MQIPNAILIPEIIRLLDEGHTVTLRLRGYSMRPFLEDDRDVALLVKADCQALVQQWTDAGILEGEDLPPVSPHVVEEKAQAEAEAPQEAAPKKKEKKGFFSKLFKN